MNQKGISALFLLLAVSFVIFISGMYFLSTGNQPATETVQPSTPPPAPSEITKEFLPSELETFIQQAGNFKLKYPKGYILSTVFEDNNNSCTMFTNQSIDGTEPSDDLANNSGEPVIIEVCYMQTPLKYPPEKISNGQSSIQISDIQAGDVYSYRGFWAKARAEIENNEERNITFLLNDDYQSFATIRIIQSPKYVQNQFESSFRFINKVSPNWREDVIYITSNNGFSFTEKTENFITLSTPENYSFKLDPGNEMTLRILDQQRDDVMYFYNYPGGESSPVGKMQIDGVNFTMDYFADLECLSDIYPTNWEPGTPSLMQIHISCSEDEQLIDLSTYSKIIKGIKFSPSLKETLNAK